MMLNQDCKRMKELICSFNQYKGGFLSQPFLVSFVIPFNQFRKQHVIEYVSIFCHVFFLLFKPEILYRVAIRYF